MILYLLVAVVLFISLLVYFRLADHFNIIDKPNNRSSHTSITIRGGGIVYPVAAVLYGVFFHEMATALLAGLLLISLVSFWDDVKNLPNKVRLVVHLLAVTALLWAVGAFQLWPVWLIPFCYVVIIGIINAYNFMDGINGITGLYSLFILASLWYINEAIFAFTDRAFIVCPLIASLVFLFFNFRKKARCFAGDVGSVSAGFWIIALLLMLIIKSGSFHYILFLAIYGVDTVLTIVHRLILKQNIFEAHRLHFYQILANERQLSHLTVSALYAGLQLIINIFILNTDLHFLITFAIICIPLALLYIFLKPRLMADRAMA